MAARQSPFLRDETTRMTWFSWIVFYNSFFFLSLSFFFFCVSRCRNLLKIEFSCVILLRPFISSYSTRSTFEKLLQPKRRGLIFKSKYEIRNSDTFARANYVLRSKSRDIFFFSSPILCERLISR